MCKHTYGRAPDILLRLPRGQVFMQYPSGHLHHIAFELFKNALRATTETHSHREELPPVRVVAVRGSAEDVSIRIMDEGGGIPRSGLPYLYSYLYSTAAPPAMLRDDAAASDAAVQSPMAGFGYGLPLARLYARYFGGDLQLVSMEGFCTDAFVFLKASSQDAQEVLPVFSKNEVTNLYRATPGTDPRLRMWTGPYAV